MGYLTELSTLMNDSLSNRVGMFDANASKFTDQAIREAFFDILGEDKLTWQSFRNHKNEIYTVMETVLTTNLPLAWEGSRFYDQFVDAKSATFGDKNEYVVEDNSILVATKFAGNYWSTDRTKLQGKKSFSIATEWIYFHIYDELERFLKGTITLAEMTAKLQKGFKDEIDTRIYTAFNAAGTYLPAKFLETGSYDKTTMANMIERVQTATQKNVVLAGTRTALANIVDGMDVNLISDAQKEEFATNGCILNLTGLGVNAIMIPQTFVRGTYDFKVANNAIYVLPDNEKPIKLWFEGDTRAKETTSQENDDMTFDAQVQTKLGCATVFNNVFGKYTIS